MQRGHFIVVEGLEGAGKSTALHTIKQFLSSYTNELIMVREPGGTRVGEVARQLLKEVNPAEPLDPRSELLLFYAARVQLVEQVIRPALLRGSYVVGDRFELSTWAYQGGGRKISYEVIAQLSSFCLQGFTPDLTIFLDVTPELGLNRAYKRGKTDRFEQEKITFFTDVYNSYHQQIKTMQNVVVIDASQPLVVVQNQIRITLQNYLDEKAVKK